MTAPARWAVILDPLGMANIVSDRQPGPGVAGAGLSGEWSAVRLWKTYEAASWWMREFNATHVPARPGEGAG